MTAPMTPRDPFTDEDVRKACLAACRTGTRETGQGTCSALCMEQLGEPRKRGCAHVVRIHEKYVRPALLAGTERLRAQGTWNEAIEAAKRIVSSEHGPAYGTTRMVLDDVLAKLDALKRPEAP